MQCLYFICERKFYPHTHVKITRQWKSNLRLATCIVKLLTIKDYWSALVISFKISKPFLSKRNFKWTLQFIQVQITAVFVLLWKSSFPVKWATCKRTQQLPTLLAVRNCCVRVGSSRELKMETFSGRRQLRPDVTSWFVHFCTCSCSTHCRRAPVGDVKLVYARAWPQQC